jgi:REP element-mobilizing transposase RayT
MTLFREHYRVESTRLRDWDYGSPGWYFVTLCTKDKKCSLGHAIDGQIVLSGAGATAETEMKSVSSHYKNVMIDRHVIMPNHVHAIIVIEGNHTYSPVETGLAPFPTGARVQLSNIVGGYKAAVTRICRANGLSGFAWQARFRDHILRPNASLNAVRDYIDRNPQNWLADPNNPATAAYLRRDGACPV